MAAVLFAVGRGQQPPSFVSFMLDIAQCHIKPAYNIASGLPLPSAPHPSLTPPS